MPYARRPRTRRPRRTTRRSTRRTYRRKLYPQRLIRTGFPRTNLVKLKYVDGVTIDPGVSGTAGIHFFRANSVFDPDYTGTGHQPMNFDLWASLYNHYKVIGAKITIHVHNPTTANGNGYYAAVKVDDDFTINNLDTKTIMENGQIRYKMANQFQGAASGNGIRLSKGFSAKKFFRMGSVTSNNSIGAPVTTNPSEQAAFAVMVGVAPGLTSDMAAMNVSIEITYLTLFSEPKEQDPS